MNNWLIINRIQNIGKEQCENAMFFSLKHLESTICILKSGLSVREYDGYLDLAAI
jgi:hypothetical protein